MRLSLGMWSLVGVSLSVLSCGSEAAPPSPKCMELASYSPTTVTPYSFATDIYPILMDTNTTTGCGMMPACHGMMPLNIDPSGAMRSLSFIDPAATVKASLLMNSIHAPTMARVSPGSVVNSFMAYKISGADGLACANSRCVASAGIGTAPCGDPMAPPPFYMPLADADRTKILDWIAQGAAD